MRTKDEMEAYARGLAEAHFYSDDGSQGVSLWIGSAHVEEKIDNLAVAVYRAMIWVQDGERT